MGIAAGFVGAVAWGMTRVGAAEDAELDCDNSAERVSLTAFTSVITGEAERNSTRFWPAEEVLTCRD